MTWNRFQPLSAAAVASCSALTYIQETHHPTAAASSTLEGYSDIRETHPSQIAANYMKSTMKCDLQPHGSANQTYNTIQQTHPAATATQCRNNDCNQLPVSSHRSGIAPVDDDPNKLYYTEEFTGSIGTYDQAAWKQESELDNLTFDTDSFLNWLNINFSS
ncbi:hypothetical protein SLEP1_g6443 [Rubroshorea leprosula]|uniref:Uncharacterized protein n=1 Tax=Rubroshorea leprosula TaxID=152421 RepID=A0AAV5HZT1_9ROSI|nr:hypothetical protein SLEP1_g6443 [Rubroshorea leprosula]